MPGSSSGSARASRDSGAAPVVPEKEQPFSAWRTQCRSAREASAVPDAAGKRGSAGRRVGSTNRVQAKQLLITAGWDGHEQVAQRILPARYARALVRTFWREDEVAQGFGNAGQTSAEGAALKVCGISGGVEQRRWIVVTGSLPGA